MSIPILELPQTFSWGATYKSLYKYYQFKKVDNFQQIKKLEGHYYFGFYFESEWRKYRYKTTLYFESQSELFRHFDIVIPAKIARFDKDDFITTFNLLKKEFGEPNFKNGMSLGDLAREKNYMSRNPEDLPEFIWVLEDSKITHHFINYWGNGPETRITPKIWGDEE